MGAPEYPGYRELVRGFPSAQAVTAGRVGNEFLLRPTASLPQH